MFNKYAVMAVLFMVVGCGGDKKNPLHNVANPLNPDPVTTYGPFGPAKTVMWVGVNTDGTMALRWGGNLGSTLERDLTGQSNVSQIWAVEPSCINPKDGKSYPNTYVVAGNNSSLHFNADTTLLANIRLCNAPKVELEFLALLLSGEKVYFKLSTDNVRVQSMGNLRDGAVKAVNVGGRWRIVGTLN